MATDPWAVKTTQPSADPWGVKESDPWAVKTTQYTNLTPDGRYDTSKITREYKNPDRSWWSDFKDAFGVSENISEKAVKLATGGNKVDPLYQEGEEYAGLKPSAAVAGAIAKSIADPVNLAPVGAAATTAKTAYKLFRLFEIGAGYGLADEALRQQTKNGDINDPAGLAKAALASGATMPAVYGVVKGAAILHGKYKGAAAEKAVTQFEGEINYQMSQGLNTQRAVEEASKKLGLVDKKGTPRTSSVVDSIKEAEQAAIMRQQKALEASVANEKPGIYNIPEYPISEPPKTREVPKMTPEQAWRGAFRGDPTPWYLDGLRPNGAVEKIPLTNEEIPTTTPRSFYNLWKKKRAGVSTPSAPIETPKVVPTIDSPAEKAYNNTLFMLLKNNVKKYGGDWVTEKTSNLIRSISDRVEDYSPKLGAALRRFELDSSVAIHKGMQETDSFKTSFSKLGKAEQRQFKKLIINEDRDGINNFLADKPELRDGWNQTQNYLVGALDRLRSAGYDLPDKDLYFPRVVKDYNKLIRDLSGQEHDQLTRIYRDAIEKKGYFLRMGEEPEKYLTDVEISELNNKFFRNRYYGGRVGTTSAVKERTVSNVPDHVLDAYDDPVQAIHKYVRHVEHNVEKRKFFGYGGAKYNNDERQSIGEIVRKAREQGDIRVDKVDQVEKLLAARFEGGERPIADWARNSKNVFYTAFLGQPSAALTQIGDLGVSTYLHGFLPTIKGMIGPKWASVDDLGIRLAAKEMEDTGKMASIMHQALKYSGFQTMDRLGKNTQINAAFRKYNKMVQSPIGEGKIRQKYRDTFTPAEMEKLIVDLKDKKVSPETKMLLWTELSNSQPISLSELPKWYLEHPNARILYMLQTFTTKQMSLFYKDSLKKMASGNPREMAIGAKNAAVYMSILTAANLGAEKTKELLKLRAPTDVESAAIANTMWRNFGLSEYVIDKLKSDNKQDVVYGLASIFGSPITAAASIKQDVEKGLFDDDYSYLRAIKHLPFGSVAYMWYGGGLEESEKAQEIKNRKQELEDIRGE